MANYWAIAIGINQYQFLQPLMYAHWDAYCLQQCLYDVQFPPHHCRLLTDTSPPAAEHATVPTRENIQHHIVDLCQGRVAADDVLWVFFSGYGVHDNGRDYLLPIDGNYTQPVSTGIPVSELFATLKTAKTSNIFVLLDMKRFGGSIGADHAQLGQHTLSLAQEHEIAVILACQPGQFSHETLALRQGLFTAAVLEGIQHSGCITLEHLTQYLGDRLPQLSEQHWRPRQDPAAVIPQQLRYQLFLPGKGSSGSPGTAPGNESGSGTVPVTSPEAPPSNGKNQQQPYPAVPPVTGQPVPSPGSPPVKEPLPRDSSKPAPAPDSDPEFWPNLLKWGGLLLVLLLMGVLIRNWDTLRGNSDPSSPGTPAENTGANLDNAAPMSSSSGNSNGLSSANDSADNDSAGISPGDSSLANASVLNFEADSPEAALEGAEQAIAAGLPLKALELLDQVPANAQTERYADLRAEAERLNNQLTQTNQAILDEALASMNRGREEAPVNQASDFHRAMTQATRIQPGQPLYNVAQNYIERWSYVILDLAKARANTGSYDDAIASAQLIPDSQAEPYGRAQQFVSQWQQQATQTSASQDAIAQASTLIQPGQASTYNDAIAQLRSIQPEQPGYAEVRAQINQWSQEILQIAYTRADSGDIYEAINAAGLVPEDAEVYLEAREAIEGWRTQVRGN